MDESAPVRGPDAAARDSPRRRRPDWSGPAPAAGTAPRTPIHALSMESAYADPELLRDLGGRGARFAPRPRRGGHRRRRTAGVPLAASISLAAGLPFAFVRKPGYRGHEIDEPPVRGADVAGRRVLLVDDAVSSGGSVERFAAAWKAWAPRSSACSSSSTCATSRQRSPVAGARHRCGEHIPARSRRRDEQRPARCRAARAHRRRDRQPLDRRRCALGSPRDGSGAVQLPLGRRAPFCRRKLAVT